MFIHRSLFPYDGVFSRHAGTNPRSHLFLFLSCRTSPERCLYLAAFLIPMGEYYRNSEESPIRPPPPPPTQRIMYLLPMVRFASRKEGRMQLNLSTFHSSYSNPLPPPSVSMPPRMRARWLPQPQLRFSSSITPFQHVVFAAAAALRPLGNAILVRERPPVRPSFVPYQMLPHPYISWFSHVGNTYIGQQRQHGQLRPRGRPVHGFRYFQNNRPKTWVKLNGAGLGC